MKTLWVIIVLLSSLFLAGCDNSFFVVTLSDVVGLIFLGLIILFLIVVFGGLYIMHLWGIIKRKFRGKK
jgi:hypothetical protein